MKLYADVTLPDGRKVSGICGTSVELDGTFLDSDTFEATWAETGEELTLDELNEPILHGMYLHEYVLENGHWKDEFGN